MIEPLDVAWTVDTMTCSAAVRGANQTDLLVVAQSANGTASTAIVWSTKKIPV